MPKDFILGKNSAKNQFDNVAERNSTVFHPTLAILMHTDLAVVVTANVGTRSVIHSLSFSLREEGKNGFSHVLNQPRPSLLLLITSHKAWC